MALADHKEVFEAYSERSLHAEIDRIEAYCTESGGFFRLGLEDWRSVCSAGSGTTKAAKASGGVGGLMVTPPTPSA